MMSNLKSGRYWEQYCQTKIVVTKFVIFSPVGKYRLRIYFRNFLSRTSTFSGIGGQNPLLATSWLWVVLFVLQMHRILYWVWLGIIFLYNNPFFVNDEISTFWHCSQTHKQPDTAASPIGNQAYSSFLIPLGKLSMLWFDAKISSRADMTIIMKCNKF